MYNVVFGFKGISELGSIVEVKSSALVLIFAVVISSEPMLVKAFKDFIGVVVVVVVFVVVCFVVLTGSSTIVSVSVVVSS